MPVLPITSTLHAPYRMEKPIHNSQLGISFQSNWRQVPLVLHELKRVNLSVSKAKMHESWTTLYIKSLDPQSHASVHNDHIVDIFQGRVSLDMDPLYHQGLHPNTKVHIYNISTYPYTVMHFSCPDRLGLFCEILEFLAPYNIQLHRAYVNAQEFIASNMFFISNLQGQPLSPLEIEFLQNLFEYDLKRKIDHHDNTY